MIGLVNKPQFDPNVFIPGLAVKINFPKKGTYNCLVVECNPLLLQVIYIESGVTRDIEHVRIPITDLTGASNRVTIKLMEVAEDRNPNN